jgi:hypothetical protein
MLTPPIERMTDEALEQKLNVVEAMIWREKNPRNLPTLNSLFQILLAEQVRRDLERQDQSRGER